MTQSSRKLLMRQRKFRLMKYVLLSAVLLCSAIAIAFIDPLEKLLQSQLTLRRGSFLFNIWEKPPLPVIMKVYIFNITNAEEFLSGVDKKIKVVEVGPYVYQEFLENKNATFNDNGTLSFVPVRHCVPIPERSVGDPNKDIVIAANLPLLGLSSAAYKYSTFGALAVSTLAKSLKAKPFLNLTVHDYLWGYEDNLVRLASNILPNVITFDRFGLMDRLFDEGHNLVSMNLPAAINNLQKKEHDAEALNAENDAVPIQQTTEEDNKNINIIHHENANEMPISEAMTSNMVGDVEYDDDFVESADFFNGIPTLDQQNTAKDEIRDYSIDQWNGSPGLAHWGYDKMNLESQSPCNTLQGKYDGTLFPRNISKNAVFFVYRKAFCRTLPIHYSHSGKQYGIDAYWYKLSDGAFDDVIDDPTTKCYCNQDKTCMKKGLGNITPCYYNIPASVSLPHFYNSDPSLVNEVEGIKPDKEKHESIIIMQPKLGVPIKVHSRIQLNLMNGDTKFNSEIKRFDNLILPVFWMEIAIEKLTPALEIILKLLFNVLPVAQKVIIYLFAFGAISCVAASILIYFFVRISEDETSNECIQRRSIKYTAVFPYIKREMAKFEDKEREMLQKTESV